MTPARWKLLRDAILVTVGSLMLLHETLFEQEPRAIVVGAGLALLGVPPVLRLDERRNEGP